MRNEIYHSEVPGFEGECIQVWGIPITTIVSSPELQSIKDCGYTVWIFTKFEEHQSILGNKTKYIGEQFIGWIDGNRVKPVSSFDHINKNTFYGDYTRLKKRVIDLEDTINVELSEIKKTLSNKTRKLK